jgi:hypothetical protein
MSQGSSVQGYLIDADAIAIEAARINMPSVSYQISCGVN